MGIAELLHLLRTNRIAISAAGGRLKTAAPKNAITAELAELIRSHRTQLLEFLERASEQTDAPERIVPAPAMRAYPLSFPQQRLWFIDRLQGGSAQYNIPIALRMIGQLEIGALQSALDGIVARHAVLRTRFEERDGEPLQVVDPPSGVAIDTLDLSLLDAEQRERRIHVLADEEVDRSFVLATDPMLRCKLIREAADRHVVLFTMHHIASDGWSMGVLVREFAALYSACLGGVEKALPPLPIQYFDYAYWQRRVRGEAAFERDLAYWQRRLAGAPTLHALPLDRPRPMQPSSSAQRLSVGIAPAEADALRGLAQRCDATLFMVLQTALALLIARWSGTYDIVIGTPVSGRPHQEVEPLIGFFINTIACRIDVSGDPTVEALIGRVRSEVLEDFAHQQLPFDLLIDALRPERSLAYNPICQIKFVLQNHESTTLSLPGLTLEPVARGVERVRFDLDLTVAESAEGLHLSWTWKEALFERSSVERMAHAYGHVLRQIVERPQALLSALCWQDAAAQAQLLTQGRGPHSERGREQPLIRQLQAQAQATPEAVAVRCGAAQMTYRELDRASNRLAQALAEQGVGLGARVGVALERSLPLLVALLGVMKSGAAYVPVDAQQAPARVQAILEDAEVALVLGTGAALAGTSVQVLAMDGAAEASWLSAYPDAAPAVALEATHSAYVLYTSGSTGVPKGVEVLQRGLTDYCAFARGNYYAEHLAGALVATSPAFDLTVPSLYVPLLAGGCVTLLAEADAMAGLAAALEAASAPGWLLRLTPSHVQGLLALSDAQPRPGAHVFVVGGEAFAAELAQALRAKYPQAQVYNHYGPTEAVVGSSWYAVDGQAPCSGMLPIGRAMENTTLYVLDARMGLQPAGVAGELYIGGWGVAKGYVKREALTAERFVASPFVAGERLYRSGDRVRWRNDGQLEFLGRLDDQVKLRGFRIELGEIESRLHAEGSVREAVVVVRGEGVQARLVAYVTPASEVVQAQAWIETLQAALASSLPGYMQPSAYVVLEALPLTVNGKVDKGALPEPVHARGEEEEAPSTETERALAQIWSGILGHADIGVTANFFALGGHSLLATRIVSEIGRALGKQVPVRALFEQPTLRGLAQYVERQARSGYAPIPKVPRVDALPLSFAQQRLWFIDRLEGGSTQYNMPVALRLRGGLSVVALGQALAGLLARHEVLRTVYREVDGTPWQVIQAQAQVPLAHEDLSALPAEAQDAAVQAWVQREAGQGFDLAHEPMLRCRVLRLEAEEHAVLFTLHHIASDGWSMGVLVREFVALYAGALRGEAAALAPLPVQYADYAAWQRERLQGASLEAALGYWRERLQGLPAVHGLPLDRPRPARQDFAGGRIEQGIAAATLAGLQALAQRHDASLFMVLEAALAWLLARWSGERDIVIGTPIAGRVHPDVEPLIGFFVNTLVLRTQLSGEETFEGLLATTRERVLEAYTHQEIPFEMLVDELKPVRSLSHAPLFQVLLSMRNTEQVALTLPGLEVSSLGEGYEQAKFDLQLAVQETGEGLRLVWGYATRLFEAASIDRLAQAYAQLLAQIVVQPDAPLAALCWQDAAAQAQLLAQGRGPHSERGREQPLIRQLQAQAQATPEAVAVRCGAAQLTYRELDRASNRLAQALAEQGVGLGARVGVALERSLPLLVALLGVMKSGAAYVPVDAQQAPARVQAILEDAEVALVLGTGAALAGTSVQVLAMDGAAEASWLSAYPDAAPAVALEATHSAYVLYTSGSTGVPKGVEVLQRGLTDYCAFARGNYYAEHLAGALVATSPAFDLTVPSLYVPLLAGGCVTLLAEADAMAGLAAALEAASAPGWLLRLTPSHVQGLLALSDAQPRPGAHVFVVGGEAFAAELAQALRAKYPQAQVYNHYGPTEAVVGSSWYAVDGQAPCSGMLPIGRAMENTTLYVLDARMGLQPAGVAGELYIGGWGVAKGYVKREALTAERFVASPFVAGERLYRSGDRVRWRNDGQLEFLGRLDDQVKLRGFRIELGEIESRLHAEGSVREAVVVVRGEAAQARLVAYVTPASEVAQAQAWIETLQAALAASLPGYMQPSAYVVLEALPLTVNGKVDKGALPEPVHVRGEEEEAPSTETERALAQIWEQVLRLPGIGVHDNFFEIGGDSILSIQIVARANQAGIGITTRQLFEAQTIAQLARCAEQAVERASQAPQGPVQGELALLPIQKQFLAEGGPGLHHYNQALLLRVPHAMQTADLRRMIEALYWRHDALRLRFSQINGDWHADHAPLDADTLLRACVTEGLPERSEEVAACVEERCAYWQSAFDLGEGPLLRAVHFRGGGTARLLLVAHHVVIDGVSWRILLADLERAYRQVERGEQIALAPKTTSLQQWGQALAAYAHSDALLAEREYWLSQCQQSIASLPSDRAGSGNGSVATAAYVRLALSAEDTQALLARSNAAYRTQINELLLAAVALGVRRWSGAAGVRVALESHGRSGPFERLDTTQTVGWFTTHYPLALCCEHAEVGATIKAVKEHYRAVPYHGIGYGVLRHLAEDAELIAAEVGKRPELTFNYLGQTDRATDAETFLEIAEESMGRTVSTLRERRHPLTLRGMVAGGQLSFTLEYSNERYEAATIAAFAGHIEQALREIVAHCAGRENVECTPSDFPLAQVAQAQLDTLQAAYPQMLRLYPATPMQQGLHFHTKLDPSAYVGQTFPVLKGALDAVRFRAAWQALVDRHDVFRTAFVDEDERLLQLVSAQATLPWHEEDWRDLPAEEQDARFEAYRELDRARSFDFRQAPLMRCALFRLGADRHRLLWTHHHMLSDGWSLPILYKEVMSLYQGLVDGSDAQLAPAPAYERYVEWLSRQDHDAAVGFWQEQLRTVEAPTPLAIDRLPAEHDSGQRERSLSLDEAASERLFALARKQRITLNTVIQLAWACVLHRYSGEDEVVFGATISGRPAEVVGVETMVGLFINSIPVRVPLGEPQLVRDALATLQARFEAATSYGYLSLAEIQRQSGVTAGMPLFDSLLVIGNYPIEAAMDARSGEAGLSIESKGRREETGYRLAFNINLRQRIHLQCAYRAEQFADATIERMLHHFREVLVTMPDALDADVRSLDPMTDAERAERVAWNLRPADYPRDQCIHALVEAQAALRPEAIAATFGADSVCYGELNRQANRVAHYLRGQGVSTDTLVGLCVERSVEMLIGMLGILKAGGAYVPLDPDYPEDRIAFMLADSGVEIVLVTSDLMQALPVFDDHAVLPLDAGLREGLLAGCPDTDPAREAVGAHGGSLAYMIYTSGSTGTPKGALIEHRSIVRLVHRPDYVSLDAGGVMAQASNSSFDAATFEIWGALANGMRLQFVAKDVLLDPNALARSLVRTGITTMFVTTAILNQMSIANPSGFAPLHCLLFGGEGVDVEAVGRVLDAGKPGRLVHVYGPTENTTFSTAYEIRERRSDTYPIGRAISGSTQHVLGRNLRPLPCGVIGELYLGGDGVGRGYHRRPELSAERFLAGAGSDAGRCYKTGDLVRQLPGGDIVFVGRVDDQVKVRGFRIELGEIQTHLLAHDAIRDTVVVARRDGETTRLVAYVVAHPGNEPVNELLLAKELRAHLKRLLPDYMVPAAFVAMDELPLNRNGKVDRQRLPEPDYQYQSQHTYLPPRTDAEQALAAIWQQVLRIDQIGVQDNFFEIGGDSILLIQVVSRANHAGLRISTRQLFQNQTIAELAAAMETEDAHTVLVSQAPVEGPMPLLPVQRMFLEGEALDRHHFNQAMLLETPPDFDATTLAAVLEALYLRHDALRLRFVQNTDGWEAVHAPFDPAMARASAAIELPVAGVPWAEHVSARCAEWQRRFHLADGPLLRAVYFPPERAGDAGRLLLAAHHIVVDGVSWRILLGDLELGYAQHARGDAVALAPKTSSLQQWGRALGEYARSETLLRERDYWLANACAGGLATDATVAQAAGPGTIATNRSVLLGLSSEDTRALHQQCNAAYRTRINELLLAAVYLGVRRWNGRRELCLRLEGHGREALFDELDLTQTVGWFTSVFPVVLDVDGDGVADAIKSVKERYRAIPRNGIGYGVLRYVAGDVALREAAGDQTDALLFNYLGQFDQILNDKSHFGPARESIGPQTSLARQRSALLALSGKTFAGQLQFTLSYSSERYEEASMRALAAGIEQALVEVVRHCQRPGVGAWTPSDFPLARIDQQRLDALHARHPELSRLYPATSMQAGMLYESLLDSAAYVVQNFPVLRGSLDLAAFRHAWQQVVMRHDAFRTAFVGGTDDLQQLVLSAAPLSWHEEDWRGLPEPEQRLRFDAYRQEDRCRGFDFERPPLMRIAVFRLGEGRYQLLWSLHHILLDGWCLPLVYRDVIEFYRAYVQGRAAVLPVAPAYERYIAWLLDSDVERARDHWHGVLKEIDAPTPLVIDRLPVGGGHGQREYAFELDEAQTQTLQAYAKAHRTTVNTLLQWAWAYLLHRYSAEPEVVFGATISGRAGQVPGVEEMIGLFINTIPVKVGFGPGQTIGDALAALHADFQSGSEYGYLSLPEIRRQSRVKQGVQLFDSLLVFENYPLDAVTGDAAASADAQLQIEEPGNSEATTFKLTLVAAHTRTLRVKFGYRAERFNDAAIARMAGHLGRILVQMTRPGCTPADIDLLAPEERGQLASWNDTDAPYPDTACIHELIQSQVGRSPGAIAVEFGEDSITYAELDARANRLAHALIAEGVAPDAIVGICMTRSVELVVAILGVLKAGGAYLPLDPNYPRTRLDYMLRDSGARIVLTFAELAQTLPADAAKILALDAETVQSVLLAQSADAPGMRSRGLGPQHLAYAIYTSGSTGEPKGVLNEHGALVNRLHWMQAAYALDANDRVLQKTPYSFDVSVWEFLWPLMAGARLVVLAPDAHADPAALHAAIRRHGITTLHFVPSMLSTLLANADWASCDSVRQVICSGEALGSELAARFFATGTRARLHNLYGPTEAAIDVSFWECRPEHDATTVPIGRPIHNIRLHVLDAHGRPQPVGVAGELHIGGVGLARGYCNKPELTRERFVFGTAGAVADTRLYRTGDLARRLPDGTLDFLGRIDHQVKIRGLRIELGEIEALLCRQDDVTDAVVTVRGAGEDASLVAYVGTPAAREAQDGVAVAERLRTALRAAVPDYMVPSAFVVLERLPLSANGKIDRKALPEPGVAPGQVWTSAQTPTEEAIAGIWRTLLRLEDVDVLTGFFELGGHSLLAVRMIGEVRERFAIHIAIRDVFERTTVRALADFVDEQLRREALRRELTLDLADSGDQEFIEL
ncbi:D-alanine--D-alanyl carrier protein ligase [Xanthomonas sp. SS]|uniref:non-ribosomal peptide synthase/polyketide synthase n=1 Tax=Xanthomonas sp. SS TaxID=2724122 RepID=UPI001862C49B|nr:non-ribosomal peptide synthase/polyketide synthase [Xanthomonas sp. SS]QNH16238.1 D-alanine--D-alanyl carrier protein ligase [Xanthomonas sp. SS]